MPRHVGWIEESSGVDITPCHTFNPSTKQWDFTGGQTCANNVTKHPTAGSGFWFVGNDDNISACLSFPLVSEADACAGWTPAPLPKATPGLPDNQAEASLLIATVGLAPFSLPKPPEEGDGFFGPTNSKFNIFGTAEKDTLQGTIGDDVLHAGLGPDVVHGHEGDDDLLGNNGDDHLMGGPGDDLILPGRGRDKVNAESGDDTVVIGGTCELEIGEVLLGGDGYDTLVSPLSIEQLKERGIIALEFETVKATHPDSEIWACDPQGSASQLLGN